MKKIVKNNTKTIRKYVNILGINIDSTTIAEVLTGVEDKVTHSQKFSIMTPNPELVLASTKNLELKNALNSATYSIPDGVGLKFADSSLNIIKGRVLFMELIKLASENGWKVFLLGGLDDEAEIAKLKIENLLKSENCKLKISAFGGPEVTTKLSSDIVNKINSFKPDLLFVALGNPKQEIFIHENLNKLNVKGMMAVGGTFRYVAGLSKLPPKWMEKLGLEWVWRFITEPNRIGRIWNAVIVFPWKVLSGD